MNGNSRKINSTQTAVHSRLEALVKKHLANAYRAPLREHNRVAYRQLQAFREKYSGPLILDSFCGTGLSTQLLARRFPDHAVIGIDQSAARLARHRPDTTSNYLLLRGQCEELWRRLADDRITLAKHFLLYPNPWPKPGQLQRRIHGHPAFPVILRLGGELELRSNWPIYVEEFEAAMHIAGHAGQREKVPDSEIGLSLFEQKYHQSGHSLWRYRSSL